MRLQRKVDTENPCPATCVACCRERPQYALETRAIDGIEVVVCINATECRSFWTEWAP